MGPDTFARKSPFTARRACFRRSDGMRARIAALSLSVFLGAAVSSAQNAPQAPAAPQIDYSTVNCSGFVTDQKVPDEIRLVSGEQSNYKITFARGDYVHINRGQDKGVRVGDRFTVVRPVKDPTEVPWFKWQAKLMNSIGPAYWDTGRLPAVSCQPQLSAPRVPFSCDYIPHAVPVLPSLNSHPPIT